MLISGLIPRSISIGTKTGAKRAHLALAEPINKLITAPNNIIKDNNSESGKLELSRKEAPLIAKISPKLDQLNIATKCAAVNARTR